MEEVKHYELQREQKKRKKERRMQMNEAEQAAVNAGMQAEAGTAKVTDAADAGTARVTEAAVSGTTEVRAAGVTDAATGVTEAGTAKVIDAGTADVTDKGAADVAETAVTETAGKATEAEANGASAVQVEVEPIFSEKIIEEGLSGRQKGAAEASNHAKNTDVSPVGNVAQSGNSDVKNGQMEHGNEAATVGAGGADLTADAVMTSADGNAGTDDTAGKQIYSGGNAEGTAGTGSNTGAAVNAAAGQVRSAGSTKSAAASNGGAEAVQNAGNAGNADGDARVVGNAGDAGTAADNSVSLPARDYEAEWKELAEAHPEIVGTTLPEDIFQACIKSDQPPLRVYESMMLQRMQGELERLKQENERLRQNHDNAQRAPVTGTLAGGATDVKEEDPFVTAFKRFR